MNANEVIIAFLMGFSLAATCGLRAFLPLLVISAGSKFGAFELTSSFEWMSSWPAIICFGTATVLEVLGDKIPAVDHFLDAAGVFVRPLAGAVAASSLISWSGASPLVVMTLSIIMGASVAGIVQAVKGIARLFSTGLTAGVANPVVSTTEDGVAVGTSLLAVFLPYVAAVLVLVAIISSSMFLWKKVKNKK